MNTVRAAGDADTERVTQLITFAFAGDPVARWTTPRLEDYLRVMPQIIPAFGGRGYAHGSVDILDSGGGAAMWLPPGIEPDSDRMAEITEQNTPAERMPEIIDFFGAMAGYHPHEPVWYLPLIGVDPLYFGKGFGAALMKHALKRSDAAGQAAYLESSNPRNISFYERLGFRRLGSIQVGSSPTLVPMLREPR